MDDIVGHVYNAQGQKTDITVRECYESYMKAMVLLYHDYMTRAVAANFNTFKKMQVASVKKIADIIHSRYADHVEGSKRKYDETIKKKSTQNSGE